MVHRIEVHPRNGHPNPKAENAMHEARSLGLEAAPQGIEQADVYLIEGDLDAAQAERIARELLADPVTQAATVGAAPPRGSAYIEVQPLAGVMDPAAKSIEMAVRALLGAETSVQTGSRYDFFGVDQATADDIAQRALANTVIHAIHRAPFHPQGLPHGAAHAFGIVEVPLRDLDDGALQKLSRDAHLFLSLDEMKAIQQEYRALGREPREIELETLAQTWSEHCVHKTLKATIRYREAEGDVRDRSRPVARISFADRPGHVINDDGSITIHNLLKSTVAAATHELIEEGVDWCLSVFVDNAGVIAFDDDWAVCFKCETHNHPSAIEPYGGAATGIGGCIRDIMGTGLAARPIASTDVFCVAHPDRWGREADAASGVQPLPAGCLHPRRVLRQVVAGVRDYGNRMGIPTVNGAVWFHDDYIGNPLVYCGCIGVMPRDKVRGAARSGDRIIALGGRTGRDGIHGATFSSAELTDTHADEFSHAVQIGNAVTEKMTLDAILAARDHERGCLYSAITDCGAGGFSSAVGEMGEALGAFVELENAPLKYQGLSPTEIWISEAQERMVLAVPPQNVDALAAVCRRHNVEMCDLGFFGVENRELVLTYRGEEVGRLPMAFLHEGIPQVMREAVWVGCDGGAGVSKGNIEHPPIDDALLALLAHPNIASKHWIIRQYDHEVQGATAIKPLVGPQSMGPGDAAVMLPVAGSMRGLAVANGLATGFAFDPYLMTLMAIDECVRNLVCVGADPQRIAILDNFCWPSCSDPESLGSLVRAAEACYDGAKAYRTPFISGKDSLNNQFTTDDGRTIRIPPTLLISGMGIVDDVRRCVTMDFKRAGNLIVLIGETQPTLRGSHYEMIYGDAGGSSPPSIDLEEAPRAARIVHELIASGLVESAHDVSDGGLAAAIAEMCIAGAVGAVIDLSLVPGAESAHSRAALFSESPARYVLEMSQRQYREARSILESIAHGAIGSTQPQPSLAIGSDIAIPIDSLRDAWRGALDW